MPPKTPSFPVSARLAVTLRLLPPPESRPLPRPLPKEEGEVAAQVVGEPSRGPRAGLDPQDWQGSSGALGEAGGGGVEGRGPFVPHDSQGPDKPWTRERRSTDGVHCRRDISAKRHQRKRVSVEERRWFEISGDKNHASPYIQLVATTTTAGHDNVFNVQYLQ